MTRIDRVDTPTELKRRIKATETAVSKAQDTSRVALTTLLASTERDLYAETVQATGFDPEGGCYS